ncbi:MAG: hypothetical protein JNJ54_31750 [Myxococcaceae bacterium]|nr:hypothetical protein [Myxococcaceae bacterium]
MRLGLVAGLVVLAGCAQTPPSKEAVAKLMTRLSYLTTDAATRAITPLDYVTTVRCDSGSADLAISTSGTNPLMVTSRQTFNRCTTDSETVSGQLTSTWTTSTDANTSEVTVTLNGMLAYEGPTYAGNFSFNAFRITTRVKRESDRITITSEVSGTVSIGGTTYSYMNESYVVPIVVASDGGTGGGSAGGSGGGSAMGGGSAGTGTTIQGARAITDLAASGETVFFTGETVANQPAIFSANATATLATVICTGAANTRLSGVVVDGTTVYALSDTSTGSMRKLVRSSTMGIGAACTEVATVDARGFFLLGTAALAKVGDLLVYKAPDGSLKGYSLTSNMETVVVQPGNSFYDTILSAGGTGVVAQAQSGANPPDLKTFTAAGLGDTVASFSKPDFTTVGSSILWAVDGSPGVAFRYRQAASGSTVSMGATANLGVPGRATTGFCETNDGVSAGVFVTKSADSFAGYYTVGLDAATPRKVTSQAYDAPVHCAVTPTRLWAVEGDLGASRNLVRFER